MTNLHPTNLQMTNLCTTSIYEMVLFRNLTKICTDENKAIYNSLRAICYIPELAASVTSSPSLLLTPYLFKGFGVASSEYGGFLPSNT